MPMRRDALLLVVFLLASFAAAAIGGGSTANAASQYGQLEQPSWAPPPWLFGPVWTVLYVLIAVAGWLTFRSDGWGLTTRLWIAQLAMNAVWSPLFFALEQRLLSLVWIIGLDVVVGLYIWKAWGKPGWLMLPYMAWISFATALNGAIWWLNRA